METSTTNKVLIVLLTLAVIYIVFTFKGCEEEVKPEYWENPNFKPQVVYVPKPYWQFQSQAKPLKHKVPPLIIFNFPKGESPNKVKCESDSLLTIIDSLGKSLASINHLFLTQYPTSNKLINGRFKLDTITLDLLQIDGNIKREVYPTNYSRFEYQYIDNQFRAEELKKKTGKEVKDKKLNHSFYINAGYNILGKVPAISTDYYIRYRRLQLDIEPKLTIEQKPTLELNAKFGIRIK